MTSEYLSLSDEYFSLFSKKTSAETVEFDGCRSCTLLCKEDSVSLHLYQISPMRNWKSPYWTLKLSCFHCLTSILPLIYPPRGKSAPSYEKGHLQPTHVGGTIIHEGPAFNQYGNSCLPAVIAYASMEKNSQIPKWFKLWEWFTLKLQGLHSSQIFASA